MKGDKFQQGKSRVSFSEQANSSDRHMFTLRKSVRDVINVVLFLNIVNVLLYNTGWLHFTSGSTFDVIWATGVCVLSLICIVILAILDK